MAAGATCVTVTAPRLVGRNVKHELKNEAGTVVHLRTRVTPAGHLEEFLTESARAAREGLYNARNLPTSLRGAGWPLRALRSNIGTKR